MKAYPIPSCDNRTTRGSFEPLVFSRKFLGHHRSTIGNLATSTMDKGWHSTLTSTSNLPRNPGYYTNPSGIEISLNLAKIPKIMNGPWCMTPILEFERPYLRG